VSETSGPCFFFFFNGYPVVTLAMFCECNYIVGYFQFVSGDIHPLVFDLSNNIKEK
jgi:hypothetical protein